MVSNWVTRRDKKKLEHGTEFSIKFSINTINYIYEYP